MEEGVTQKYAFDEGEGFTGIVLVASDNANTSIVVLEVMLDALTYGYNVSL